VLLTCSAAALLAAFTAAFTAFLLFFIPLLY
jgi:hypothetical protein